MAYVDRMYDGVEQVTKDIRDTHIRELLADEFSTDSTYKTGDLVIHDGELYRFKVDHAAGAWNAAQVEKATIGSEVTDLKGALNDKADIIVSSASGAIASFEDGADDLPVKELNVGIEPVQDLHGYDHPWPAGGGKNLFNKDNISSPETVAVTPIAKGVTVSVVTAGNNRSVACILPVSLLGKTITIHADVSVSSTNYARIALYFAGESSVTTNIVTINGTGSKTTTIQVPESFPEGSTGLLLLLYACTTGETSVGTSATYDNLQVEIGSEATDYEPYSNICPITGFTGVNISRVGKNLFVPSPSLSNPEGYTLNGVTMKLQDDGRIKITGTATEASVFRVSYLKRARTQNELTGPGCLVVGKRYRMIGYNPKYVLEIANPYWTSVPQTGLTFTCNYSTTTEIRLTTKTGKTYNDVVELMISDDLNGDTWEPYLGTKYPITFPSEAGTVYGGELTVNQDGTGELVVTREKVVIPENVTTAYTCIKANPYNVGVRGILNASKFPYLWSNQTETVLKSNFAKKCLQNISDYMQSQKWTFFDGEWTSVAEFQAVITQMYADGIEPYIIATLGADYYPTYTLTAQQVRTLLGHNNIWADAGDVDVSYRADTKLYIDNKITQAIAAAMNS